MPTAHAPSLAALHRAIELSEEIQRLEVELKEVLTGTNSSPVEIAEDALAVPTKKTRGRKKGSAMSAETKAKMAAAQQARWAKPGKTEAAPRAKKKHVLSSEGRARIVAALKARHAAKKKTK